MRCKRAVVAGEAGTTDRWQHTPRRGSSLANRRREREHALRMSTTRRSLTFLLATTTALAQHDTATDPSKRPMYVAPASDAAQKQIAAFQLPPGLVCDLVAAEPDLCNPVAFAFDNLGRCYVAETFRINDGVFDNRSYMQWKDDDLACLTVADRLAKYEKHIAKDIPKYTAYSERIRLLVDTDKNGTLDRSTVFADGFSELADGIASGVLPVGNDVWFTNIPKLWKLRDSNGDGIADERTAVHDGYGVHTSLIGHDLHGLIVGPDRRLYFSIGDRGLHVQQGEHTFAYPHEGAVLRCELDGSQLEVVHRGLRNPQELAFDAFGDLFTGDNNSDGGDRARLVQIVQGADTGWRIGYQWLDDRGAWNREQLWHPRHPQQSARILPPIANFADGPSGLVFDPGIGLGDRFRGCFFLCDFRGGASYSGVHAIRLERQGAGYSLASTDKVIWNVLATDVDFGPDGSMYVLDWVTGWNKSGKGRIYRVRTANAGNDLALRGTATLLGSDLKARGAVALQPLLGHPDRRVWQAAQFALVDLGAHDVLTAVANARDAARLARVHAVFGLGMLGRRDPTQLDGTEKLLDDGDPEVRAIAARVLGEAKRTGAIGALQKRLQDGSARVQREAALALAAIGSEAHAAVGALFDLLRHNDDHDAVLRHAAVLALAACADRDALLERTGDAAVAVRRGALLALARRLDAEVARFLRDADVTLRADAARAIYEGPIPGAMRELAKLCYDDTPDDAAVDWRAINACRVLSETEYGEALVQVAARSQHPTATRREALAVLAEWKTPHGQCRVTGNWRPCTHENPHVVAMCLTPVAAELLLDAEIAAATVHAIVGLELTALAPNLQALVGNGKASDDVRVTALDALATLKSTLLEPTLAGIGADAPVPLRKRAVALLQHTNPEQAVPVLASLLANASLGEQQAALEALGGLQHVAATALLRTWLQRLERDDVPAALRLDLTLAAEKHAELAPLLTARAEGALKQGPLQPFADCLEGGDRKAGRAVFFDHEATRCTRCHTLGGSGGNAGPVLDAIGKQLTRQQLLEALITPSLRIAEGFGTVTIELDDATSHSGVITKDQDGGVTLVPVSGEPVNLQQSRIRSRTPNAASAMPPMGTALSKAQIRDLIEFLSKQQKGD